MTAPARRIRDAADPLAPAYKLQLPYLNRAGYPMLISIDAASAARLRRAGTHRILPDRGQGIVLSPIVPAAQGVVFQEGEPAL